MKRINALLIALALAAAVIAGTFAALRTTQLGAKASTPSVSAAQIAKQNSALARAEAALQVELKRKPPALKALPAAAAAPAANQTVIYRRPPAVVHVIHRPGGEHESEGEKDSGHEGLDD